MTDPLHHHVQRARELLAEPLPDSPVDLTTVLTHAQAELAAALDEAMARAALGGASVRTIAAHAEVAPNSVPPRLARSASLQDYAEAGKVSAEGLAVARADLKEQRSDPERPSAPFTFTPRRRTP